MGFLPAQPNQQIGEVYSNVSDADRLWVLLGWHMKAKLTTFVAILHDSDASHVFHVS